MLLVAFSAARGMVHVLLLHGNTKWRNIFYYPKCQFQMYKSRSYEKSTSVEANGTVMGRPNEQLYCFHLMKYVFYSLIQTGMRGSDSSSGWTDHHTQPTGRKTLPFTHFFLKTKQKQTNKTPFCTIFFPHKLDVVSPVLQFPSIDDFSTKEERGALQSEGRLSLPLLFWQSGMDR